MEFLLSCILIMLFVRWLYLRRRLNALEERMDRLSGRAPQPVQHWPIRVHPKATEFPRPPSQPRPQPAAVEPERLPPAPAPAFAQAPAPPQPTDWETVLGGNWLNKIGVLILVIGIALALGYSFTYMGPAGRVATCLAASLALITSGVLVESRERYETFGRGLIGGGWAALYITVYAMHAVDAARVVGDPWVAALLLMGVAAGMIVHSLVYRSQTVSGLAYFIAFVTLAITEVNVLSFTALVPLAASLLYVARRFGWRHFAVLGAAATYLTCLSRG